MDGGNTSSADDDKFQQENENGPQEGRKVASFQVGDEENITLRNGQQPRQSKHSTSQDPQAHYKTSGSNSGRSSQDYPRMRHISATVAPNPYVLQNGNKMRRNHSANSLHSQSHPHRPKSKNGMVLQLVLPNAISNGSFDNADYSTAPMPNDTMEGGGVKRRTRNGSVHSSPQGYSPYGFGAYNNHGYNGFDFPNNMGSGKNPPTAMSDASHVTPTSPEEKKRRFREYLTTVLSFVYGAILITLGVTIYVSNVIIDLSPLPEIYSYYIVLSSFFFILYIIIDINIYMSKRKKYIELMENNTTEHVEFQENADGGINLNISLPAAAKLQEPLPHHYCFSTGRHAGSFFLKLGAAAFCLGHMIHNGLHLAYQFVFLASDGDAFYECSSVATLVLDVFYPFYGFLLLYFIFKYMNVIINRNVPLATFGFMHCMAASLVFWIHTIIRETFDALAFYGLYEENYNGENGTVNGENGGIIEDTTPDLGALLYAKRRYGGPEFNRTTRLFTPVCAEDHGMSIIYQSFSPYLYPFSVEYNILVVGILYIVWSSIGTCKKNFEHNSTAPPPQMRDCDSNMEGPEPESNLTIHVDLHSSNKGIFFGIFVFIILIINIILFFIAVHDERFSDQGITVNTATELVILAIMGVAAVGSYWKIIGLDVTHHHISLLDDVLLFICIPAFVLNAIFSIRAAIYFENGLGIAFFIIQVAQVIIQTSFIIDALRRCSNCRELRQKKPGREVVTFLVITNVAMWVHQTFEVRGHGLHDDRYAYFGQTLWAILGHVCLPLMMFYRFHAAVCLVDVWNYAYEKASH